jgi:hypothetical protein
MMIQNYLSRCWKKGTTLSFQNGTSVVLILHQNCFILALNPFPEVQFEVLLVVRFEGGITGAVTGCDWLKQVMLATIHPYDAI